MKKIALAAFSLIGVGVAVEFALRLFWPVEYMGFGDAPAWTQAESPLHRASEVPGLDYELSPSREILHRGALIRTNSTGLRDDESRPPGDDSVRRIAVLGDSFTFGFGVSGDQVYANVLERMLAESRPAAKRPIEVLNFGVGAYSTRDEAVVLEQKALAFAPDLVVVGYALNDPEIDPVQPLHRVYHAPGWWQHSHLLRWIASAVQQSQIRSRGDGDYVRYLHAPGFAKWQSVVDAFAAMRRATEPEGIPVLVVIFPLSRESGWEDYPYRGVHRQVAEAAAARGLSALDLYDAFAAHPAPEMRLAASNPHPSARGHEVAARAIHDWLIENSDGLALELGDNP